MPWAEIEGVSVVSRACLIDHPVPTQCHRVPFSENQHKCARLQVAVFNNNSSHRAVFSNIAIAPGQVAQWKVREHHTVARTLIWYSSGVPLS